MADTLPKCLTGDPMRLRQVLMNLVGNAIKFTPHGSVLLRVTTLGPAASVPDASSPNVTLEFSVTDTGIGISPEDQQRIFAPFVQSDASNTRRYGGSGLGLTIARRLVDMMGGRIELESQLGVGSTFRFKVEMALCADEPPATASQRIAANAGSVAGPPSVGPAIPLLRSHKDCVRPLRVLLVEDTRANQKLVARILGKRGHVVEVAENGQDAVALLASHDFDAVLMDVQMPVMDGFQATVTIRALTDPKKARVPVIAMTAHALKSDEQRCLDAGMNAFISKPIDGRELIDSIERLTS
jgi:CheY-like chemotaxis protein